MKKRAKSSVKFVFNFHAPVAQNIAHVDRLEAHFDKDMNMQVIDTKSEECTEQHTQPQQHSSKHVKGCFRFPSEHLKGIVESLVKDFYLGRTVNLALIYVVLFDHGQLYKRNGYTDFVRTLTEWGILQPEADTAKIVSGMASKLRNPFPAIGYRQWPEDYLNEKRLCILMGEKLPNDMPYGR